MLIRRSGLFVTVILSIGLFASYKHLSRVPENSTPLSSSAVSRVAILSPMDGPVIDEIVRGFQETLTSEGSSAFEFKLYNARGTRSLMRSQVEDILAQESFSLILAVGTLATQMATEITTARDKRIPIIFCAINDPAKLGVVASEEHTGNHVTGVTGGEWQIVEQLDLLCRFVPSLKKVLIPYDPAAMAGALAGMKEKVQELLEEKGVAVEGVVLGGWLSSDDSTVSNLYNVTDDVNVVMSAAPEVSAGVYEIVYAASVAKTLRGCIDKNLYYICFSCLNCSHQRSFVIGIAYIWINTST